MDNCALDRSCILAVVLAGGQSRRFGQDKAAASLDGCRLIELIALKASRQAKAVAISGRDYGLGLPAIPDIFSSEGPLTGVVSALQWAKSARFSAIVTFSCDAPFFPKSLVARLSEQLTPISGCSVVSVQGKRQPAFALWRITAYDPLLEYYAAGVRSLTEAQDLIGAVAVPFGSGQGPDGEMFFNINNREDYARAQAWLKANPGSGAGISFSNGRHGL
jgi:molybdopterin-guanine dinucleotide biosynthesis protein A